LPKSKMRFLKVLERLLKVSFKQKCSLMVCPSYRFYSLYSENFDITAAPFFGFDANCMTLFIKSIPKNISRWDIQDAIKNLPGYLSLSLSEPLRSQNFVRCAFSHLWFLSSILSILYRMKLFLGLDGFCSTPTRTARRQRRNFKNS